MIMESESGITVGVEVEMHLKKIIAESREIAQAINGFADKLEQIEKKYADEAESEEQQKRDDDKIRVGDEVIAFEDDELKRIVVYINDAGDVADTVLPSGMIMSCLIKDLTKTGKHYSQIDEVLKELRGDEE